MERVIADGSGCSSACEVLWCQLSYDRVVGDRVDARGLLCIILSARRVSVFTCSVCIYQPLSVTDVTGVVCIRTVRVCSPSYLRE